MKIDMSPRAITLRLKQVSQLRRMCLALANSDTGKRIREKFADDKRVRRTSRAMGH